MIRSMTGYGRAQQIIGEREITVEIKSVNHRYFEFYARVPRNYGYIEDKLKSHMMSRASRGKIEVNVGIVTNGGGAADVETNLELTEAYVNALRKIGKKFDLRDDITVTTMCRFTDIFLVRKAQDDEDAVWEAVRNVADLALEGFLRMREAEGEKLKRDIFSRLELLGELTLKIEQRAPAISEEYRERLVAKLNDILQDKKYDEQRILTEAAIFAERIAVAEETVRLGSHFSQFEAIMDSGEPVGRKLDFLVQEINREVNTIGSKAQDAQVAAIVIEMKSELEKIREQIQNVE